MNRAIFTLGILTVSLIVAAAAPSATAHACRAEDPKETCGECTERWWDSSDHRHQYENGDNYCKSGEGCDAALALRPDGLGSSAPTSASIGGACGTLSVLP
jgi:hypothetical protein